MIGAPPSPSTWTSRASGVGRRQWFCKVQRMNFFFSFLRHVRIPNCRVQADKTPPGSECWCMGGSIKVKCAAFDLSDFLSPLIYSSLLSSPSMHCQAAFPSHSLHLSLPLPLNSSFLLPSYLIHVISHLFAWHLCHLCSATQTDFCMKSYELLCNVCCWFVCWAIVDCVFLVVSIFFSGIQASGWEKPVVTSNGRGVPVGPTAGLPLWPFSLPPISGNVPLSTLKYS